MRPGSFRTVSDWLLGTDAHRRIRASQSLLALGLYAIFAVVQHAEVLSGLIDPTESWRLTAAYLGGGALFFAVVRSGWSERVRRDPSLTMPQALFGLCATVGSYAITGPARGGVLSLLIVFVVFAMFSLRPEQARRLAILALVLLASVMVVKTRTDPFRYPARVEVIHYLFAVIVVSSVELLARRVGAMRDRLRAQKIELRTALDLIGEMAACDELTGLPNRRHMASLVRAEQERLRQQGGPPATLALLDIDHFKRINDTYGHAAGDAVLTAFAELSRSVLRQSSTIGRWGGEEFLILLPGSVPEEGRVVVERLRAAFAAATFDSISPGLKVSFSAGLSTLSDEDSIEVSIEGADRAMYHAKTAGRNRLVLAAVESERSRCRVNGVDPERGRDARRFAPSGAPS